MGQVIQIIQLIICLGPLLTELMKAIKAIATSIKETVNTRPELPADASDEEKLDSDLKIQKTVFGLIKQKAQEEGISAPDNIINLAAILSNELEKKRAGKIMEERGKPDETTC